MTTINKSLSLNKLNINRDFTKPRLNVKLEPWQITGFTDAEGGFFCSILNTGTGLTGFRVKLEYKVTQKRHSEGILYELQEYFNCGSVVIDNRKTDTKKYHISSLSNIIENIIPHFDSYPCLTSKYLNYKDWKQIALIMSNKEHLTIEGLTKIQEINSKMNTQRHFEDKYLFCKSYLGLNSKLETTFKLPEQWVQTFIDGEGTFYNYISPTNSVNSSLEIAQNSHDIFILLAIKHFFNSGYIKPKYNINDIYECKNSQTVNRYINRDSNKIIQFLDKFPLLTRKELDYRDWKQIVELKMKGAHKTSEGLEQIKQIKAKMNSKREF